MTADQRALDRDPDRDDDWLDEIPDGPAYPDLRGQGLTAIQLHTIADVTVHGDLL